jgi:hypothetical protein
MKKYVLGFVLLLTMFAGLSFTNNIVTAGEPSASDLIDYTYQFNVDGVLGETTTIDNVNYGTVLSVDSGSFPQSGKEYVGYLENGKVTPTLNAADSVILTDNTDLTFIYKTAGSFAVILMDSNQDFLNILFTDGSGNVSIPSDVSGYSKPGLTATGWTDGTQTVTSSTVFTEDTVVYVEYGDSLVVHSLNVTNGTGSNSYSFNEEVTVTANGSGTFCYWTKDGEIASYDESYTFTVASNHSLVAVYDVDTYINDPEVFVGVSEFYEIESGVLSLVGQFDLPSDVDLIEWGIVYSASNIDVDLDSGTKQNSNKINPDTNEFVISFDKSSIPTSLFYKAFVVSKDSDGVVSTSYSEMMVYSSSIDYTKIWFYNSIGWSIVHAHYWPDNSEFTGTSNPVPITKENDSDWWYVYVPTDKDVNDINILFASDSAYTKQTVNIDINGSTGVYNVVDNGNDVNGEGKYLIDINNSKNLSDSSLKLITIWFQDYWNYNTANAWAWDSNGNLYENWPGPNLLYEFTDSNDRDWYTINIVTNLSQFDLIVSNNGHSTERYQVNGISILSDDIYLYWDNNSSSWTNSTTAPF